MPPKIKICGISTEQSLDALVAARVEYCGFVFFPPSPRNVDFSRAALLAQRAGNAIRKVGLFVDADDAFIAQAVESGHLDALQFHGEETPERVAQARARFGVPVWKALPVAKSADIARADAYAGAADLILFDAKTPKGGLPGGMGLSFDWTLLAGYRGKLGWGLAGGLDAGNVADAIAVTGAPLVDASSGLESQPGKKDIGMIQAFCTAVRG